MATATEATTDSSDPAMPSVTGPAGDLEVNKLFRQLIKFEGSDLHLKVGKPPILRIKGTLRELQMDILTKEKMEQLCFAMMDDRAKRIFDVDGGADFAHIVEYEGEDWRFRVNLFIQMGHVGMVSRKVERFIPNFAGLNLPPIMEKLCQYDQGMVLLAGVTGSGKSTTIASMLDWINERKRKHILTIEDPIEFVYTENKSLINQREVGIDVKDFEIAMKHAVRQDPDIMLVGEMRDKETFSTAMHAAETGHLVFGTIHASTAPSTIGRILDLFPQDMHTALRSSMGFNLNAIVAQKLLPTIRENPKRVPTVEIMTMNPTIRKLVIEEMDEKLPDAIIIGRQEGMQTFNDSLKYFIDHEFISRATAFEVSPNVEQLKMILKGIEVKSRGIL
ncbi:Twitching mobility protein [Symmachiella dynata]|uniref:Twitching mobility protein n=2 Tax=Symmachiella dynata TaxID=2527995 RepID=A0A517ZKJ3_9PLAN|nr:PilT/PilU family type 4a pilus ATPase [Symmachiella dynata]QDT47399.1 Twitching mobility protein [Symmachiella dynata]QDU42977.1 Twitching mobility protein [Symmachiella dynata]